jgi:methyl-accepting chemotaxis protein
MLLNEFLKEHKKVQEQGISITELKKEIQALTATVKQQAAQIQKVSARIDATKPLSHFVLNNP